MFQSMTLSETLALTQMKILKTLLLGILSILLVPLAAQSNSESTADITPASLTIQHQLTITLKPDNNELVVKDIVTLPDNGQSAFIIKLNSLFHLRYQNRPLHPVRTENGFSSYHLAVDDSRQLTLRYKGKLESTEECAWLKEACVLLNQKGVFLDSNSHWYPDIEGAMHRFKMEVVLPKKWVSLSQGIQIKEGWQEDKPQQTIYLLAGPFRVYESQPDPSKPKAMVYLQQNDDKLAQRYLQATLEYLEQYSRTLGAYPYTKFATVESFWETGQGMPSFTLLGSKTMRLPLILQTAFPHEVLHNWWGNGVYVDSRDGNWSEGLTAYLADHQNRANKMARVASRREALQKYQTYTAGDNDFPLRDFRSRHDHTTQAVGYNKALMLFHMLRKQLGDKQFFASLKSFYHDYQFRFAGFKDLQQAFADHSKQNLDHFFQQWRDQTGAPQLKVANFTTSQVALASNGPGKTYLPVKLALTLRQTQQGPPFSFTIPLKIEDGKGNYNHQTLQMSQPEQHYTLTLPSSTRRILIDPDFDVLRLPNRHEVPAAFNALFNREAKTFVLPHKTPEKMDKAWRRFAAAFAYDQNNVLLQYDDTKVAANGTIVLLGLQNSKLKKHLGSNQRPFELTEAAYTLNNTNYSSDQHSLALALQSEEQQIILIAANTPEGLNTLARKLPHYEKYSYILLNNATTEVVAKGQWQVTSSPMTLQLTTK